MIDSHQRFPSGLNLTAFPARFIWPPRRLHRLPDASDVHLGAYDAAFRDRGGRLMPPKRSSSAPGDADKLIAHQARILRRRASPSTTTGWQNRAATQAGHLEDYLGAVLARGINAAPNPAPASASATPGSRRSKRSPTSISPPNQHRPRPDRPTRSRWLARRNPQYRTARPARDRQNTSGHHWVSPPAHAGHRVAFAPATDGSPDSPKHTAPTDSMPNYARSPATDSS